MANSGKWLRWWLGLAALAAGSGGGHAQAQMVRPDGTMEYGVQGYPPVPCVRVGQPGSRTVRLLADALAVERSAPRRAQILRQIGQCRRGEAVAILIEAMKDAEPLVRAEAARAAGLLAKPLEPPAGVVFQEEQAVTAEQRQQLLEQLSKLANDSEATVRREAVLSVGIVDAMPAAPSLASFSSPTSAGVVARALEDADEQVILAGISMARTQADAQVMARKLATWPADVQVRAIAALGRMQATGAEYLDLVTSYLDGSIPQKAAALESLGAMKASAKLPAVLERLADDHATVRRQAVLALIHLAPQELRRKHALRMLDDADATVREAAARLLATAMAPQTVDPLVRQLSDPYRRLHDAALQALLVREPEDVRQACIEAAARLLDEASPRRREDGSYVLGELRSNAAIEKHVALLTVPQAKDQVDVRLLAQAARSLGQIGDVRAADAVVKLALHEPGELNTALAEAILAAGRLGRSRAVMPAAAAAIRAEWDPRNQPYGGMLGAAAWTLGMTGNGHVDPALAARLMELLTIIYIPPEHRVEGIKALALLGRTELAGKLEELAATDSVPRVRWMAHWAANRLRGTQTPFTPAPVTMTVEGLSVEDLSGK